MKDFFRRHTSIALLNLLLIASIGCVLRYKIAFSLPFIDQKNLLHGHSHFAFAGWVTQAIMLLFVHYLYQQSGEAAVKKYKWILNANLLTAYGMLISFPIQGYGLFSIFFSTANIFVGYAFALLYWKQLDKLPQKTAGHLWMKFALLFNALSSVGAFSLAYMMATKNQDQHLYLAAIYFYLHFQYNGWFFFGCMGLAGYRFFTGIPNSIQEKICMAFATACIPAYVLSALWLPLPGWTYSVVVVAAFVQLIAWLVLVKHLLPHRRLIQNNYPPTVWITVLLSGIALTIKLLLQLGSTIPSLSALAFGFRPIVIGYLHLILLGVVTLFLLGFIMAEKLVELNRLAITGIRVFSVAVIVNELLLMIQGLAAMASKQIVYINEALLVAALSLLLGVGLLWMSQQTKYRQQQ